MKNNLKKIEYFPIEDVKKIAALHQTKFYKRVAEQGKDKDGNQLPEYSESYLDFLQSDAREGGKRIGGLKGISIDNSPAKIAKRKFRLRGRTMSNFGVRDIQKDEYQLGWDGEAAGIVEINANRRIKRDIIGVPDKEMDWVVNLLGKSFDRQINKVKNITVNVG